MRTWAVGAALVGMMWAFGCSSESSSPSKSVPLSDAPRLLAESLCTAVNDCDPGLYQLLAPGEDCKTHFERTLSDGLSETQSEIDAGRMVYHGSELQACADAVRIAGCKLENALRSDTCLAALDGTVPLGGNCSSNDECKGVAYCNSEASAGTCPGKCTAVGKQGDTCSDDEDCDVGFACSPGDQRCHEEARAGESCGGSAGLSCALGLYCFGANQQTNTEGTCKELAEIFVAKSGESCNIIGGPLCATNLSCVLTAVQPKPAFTCIEKVGPGASCQFGYPDPCPTDQYCKRTGVTLAGVCTPRPATGEPCGPEPFNGTPAVCAPSDRCQNGTCQAQKPLGGSCESDDGCLSSYCFRGKCTLKGACAE